ncbi:hypothetical protein QR680_013961 [Steinernema hermaphroditum]|uniref:WAP domain-containing protein n=1 Tax=Steinernema hermaphroditum TaxID=289476 RepID=A0AA39I9B6_9BILA|nr:hypothetical protein QR680_013961 [Steinernema hermaphroditum]
MRRSWTFLFALFGTFLPAINAAAIRNTIGSGVLPQCSTIPRGRRGQCAQGYGLNSGNCCSALCCYELPKRASSMCPATTTRTTGSTVSTMITTTPSQCPSGTVIGSCVAGKCPNGEICIQDRCCFSQLITSTNPSTNGQESSASTTTEHLTTEVTLKTTATPPPLISTSTSLDPATKATKGEIISSTRHSTTSSIRLTTITNVTSAGTPGHSTTVATSTATFKRCPAGTSYTGSCVKGKCPHGEQCINNYCCREPKPKSTSSTAPATASATTDLSTTTHLKDGHALSIRLSTYIGALLIYIFF